MAIYRIEVSMSVPLLSNVVSDIWYAEDRRARCGTPREIAHSDSKHLCSPVISEATLHSCLTIQNPAERAGLNSTTLTIVGIPICSASPLAHGFLPIAKQRRQEIAQNHPRSGLDLYCHRHAG